MTILILFIRIFGQNKCVKWAFVHGSGHDLFLVRILSHVFVTLGPAGDLPIGLK